MCRAASEPCTESSMRARLPPTVLHLQATGAPFSCVGLWLLFRAAGESCVAARLAPRSPDTPTQPQRMQTPGRWTPGESASGASCCSEDNPMGQSEDPSSQLVALGPRRMDNLCCSPERRQVSEDVQGQLPSPGGHSLLQRPRGEGNSDERREPRKLLSFPFQNSVVRPLGVWCALAVLCLSLALRRGQLFPLALLAQSPPGSAFQPG